MGEWGGVEFESWNVRKSGEIMIDLLQPKDMSGSGTKRKQIYAPILVCMLLFTTLG